MGLNGIKGGRRVRGFEAQQVCRRLNSRDVQFAFVQW